MATEPDFWSGLYGGVRDIGSSFQNWMDGRDVRPEAGYSAEDLALARQALLGKLSSNVVAASMGGLTPAQRAQYIAATGDAVPLYGQMLGQGIDRTRAGLAAESEREDQRLVAAQRARLEQLARQRAGVAVPAPPGGATPVGFRTAAPAGAPLPTIAPQGPGGPVQGEALPPLPGTDVAAGPVPPRSVGAAPGVVDVRAANASFAQAREAVLNDPNLSPEQQQAALAAISQRQAAAAQGLPPGTQYRGPNDASPAGRWDAGLPPATGRVAAAPGNLLVPVSTNAAPPGAARFSYDRLPAAQRAVADQVQESTGMPREIFTGVWGRESSHRMAGVERGDGGRAAGIGQMHQGALADVNRTYGTNWTQEDLERDPNLAATVAARYWVAQKERFGSDHLATLAYNWGPAQVATWVQSGGGWDRVPEIRRQYVADVHGAANVPGLEGNLAANPPATSPTNPGAAPPADPRQAQSALAREAAGGGRSEGWWDDLRISPEAALSIMQQPKAIRERVIANLYEEHHKKGAPRQPQIFGSAEGGYYVLQPGATQAQPLVPGQSDGRVVPKSVQETEEKLRTEFTKATGGFEEAQRAFLAMPRLAADDTGTSDTALIFSLFKTIDPASTVREGEFATVQNAASIPERLRNSYNAAISGTKLTAGQRAQIVEVGRTYYEQQARSYGAAVERYGTLATQYGAAPERVVRDIRDQGARQDIDDRRAAAAYTPERVQQMSVAEIGAIPERQRALLPEATREAVQAKVAGLDVATMTREQLGSLRGVLPYLSARQKAQVEARAKELGVG